MEAIEDDDGNLKATNFDEDEARKRTFSELKTYNLDLLDLLQNPKKKPSSLPQLHRFLSRSSPHTLQPFFEYVLFCITLFSFLFSFFPP